MKAFQVMFGAGYQAFHVRRIKKNTPPRLYGGRIALLFAVRQSADTRAISSGEQ